MLFCELKEKEVICARDCKRLGHIIDIEFDECKGCIKAVTVKDKGKWCNIFFCDEQLRIPYHKICKIGPDIVLVDL